MARVLLALAGVGDNGFQVIIESGGVEFAHLPLCFLAWHHDPTGVPAGQ